MKKIPPRTYVFIAVFFLFFAFLLYNTFLLIEPFASAMLWAVVIAFATNPIKNRILVWSGNRENLTAALMTTATVLLVVIPVIFFLFSLSQQLVEIYQEGDRFIRSGQWKEVWNTIRESSFFTLFSGNLEQPNLRELLLERLQELSTRMAAQLGGALKNVFLVLFNFLIMILSLFFFYRDGGRYYSTIVQLIPIPGSQKEVILAKIVDTFEAVIYGAFLIGIIQGVMTGIGLALFGIPFSLLWGGAAFVTALIPVVGAASVWIPAVLYLLFSDRIIAALLLTVWGTLLISAPDNLLRPILVGRRARLPVFFLFIGILGGLRIYGMLGILLGPLIVTLLLAFTGIYRETYHPEEVRKIKSGKRKKGK